MDSETFRFLGICVDRRRMAVTRDGVPAELEPKALDVLVFLIDHRDRLVPKEELLDVIWKDTFVTPNVLTRAVAQIRRVLGDDADEPRIIETVAKRGYRFIAPVEGDDRASVASPLQPPSPTAPRPGWLGAAVAAGVIVVLLVFGWAGWAWSREPTASRDDSDLSAMKRLTTRAGFNGQPAISPDGRSVAYVSDRTGSLEIYVTGLVATGTERALTSNGAQNVQPDWSPDGQWIAFHSRKPGGIWVVPAEGGQPRQVATSGSNPSWAPDSARLVFTSDSGGFAEQATLSIVRRDGSDLKALTRPGQPPGGAVAPVWSHNGKLVAFANLFGGGSTPSGLFVLSIADGALRQVPAGPWQGEARFGPRDDTLYWFGVTDTLNTALRRVSIDADTGEVRGDVSTLMPIQGSGEGLSINRDGMVAFGIATDDDNFWALEKDAAGAPGEPVRLTNDTVRNNHPDYSRTGRIAFMRFVPGSGMQSWIMREDGSSAEVLLPGTQASNPMWSADGSRVFVIQDKKAFWVDLASRRTTEIPIPVAAIKPSFPKLAPDGQALAYHRIEADGQMSVWVQPLAGGAERRVAADAQGVGFPIWSPDGKLLAVEMRRGADAIIGVVPADGSGPIREIVTDRGNSWPDSWSPDNQRVAYAGERDGVWNLYEVNVATKVSRPLTRFTLPIGYVRYPQWSRDGRRLVFERLIRSASIWTMTVK